MIGPTLIEPGPDDLLCDHCGKEPAYVDTWTESLCGWCATDLADALRYVGRQAQRRRQEAQAEERKRAAFDPSTPKPEPITQCPGQLAMETT